MDIRPGDLNASYQAATDLHELEFPARARSAFESRGIRTVGELLCTTASALCSDGNFASKTVDCVRKAILDHLQTANGLKQGAQVDYSSFMAMLQSCSRLAIRQPQRAEIFLKRMRWADGHKHTLNALGKRYRLSRERIRQIAGDGLATLKSPRGLRLLDRFWQATNKIDTDSSPTGLETLAQALAKEFNWQHAPAPELLARTLSLNEDRLHAATRVCVGSSLRATRSSQRSLRSMTIHELRRCLESKEADVRRLVARRERLAAQLTALDVKIRLLTGP